MDLFFTKYLPFLYFIFSSLLFNKIHSEIIVNNEISRRYGHTATYIYSLNKIYCIGGKTEQGAIVSDVLSLDLASSLTIESADFENLTVSGNVIPSLAWAASAANKTHLFLYGGIKYDQMQNIYEMNSDIYALNVEGYQWTTLNISGSNKNKIQQRRGISMVLDSSNRLYIFGGSTDTNDSQNLTAIADNNMYILHVDSMILNLVSPNSYLLPPNRYDYSATLLDIYIVYVGGKTEAGSFIGMDEIWMFDTNNSQWKHASANNSQNVPNRAGHTAVKLNNGPNKILIYGGYNTNSTEITNNNAIVILNTLDFTSFTWSIPTITFQDPYLQNLSIPYWHAAITYGNYMIVTFGKLPPDALSRLPSNNTYPPLLLLNATKENNMQWMTSTGGQPLPFAPPDNSIGNPAKNQTTNGTNSVDQQQYDNTAAKTIIGAIIGGVLCVALLLFLLFKVHSRAIDRKEEEKDEAQPNITLQQQTVHYPAIRFISSPPGYS
ncbi:8697_t:CDS:2 [Ambispora leptoticha]|uniref:8697_t:CDS:1 n=1 Tax=Ambispora leptoticha TaxID=144679 RepID=A0A9N8WPC6_9GLOM|nr:8697_t:CDS:2 [Ambispora leptoticha]